MNRMFREFSTVALACVFAAALAASGVSAGDAPDAIHYQGVLRDAAGAPLDGSFDMTFRFYDASVGGGEILRDEHLAVGTGAVPVDGGLFSVALGTGSVSDGGGAFPNEPYTTVSEVFRDFTDVWVEIQIGAEVLSPRVKVVSAGHALNADFAVQAESADAANTANTATSANTATNATNADDSNLLDGLDATQFLRSDEDASSTNNLTAFSLRSQADLYVNHDGPDGGSSVYFYDNGSPTFQFLQWNDVQDFFQLSNDLFALSLQTDDDLLINSDGPDGTRGVYFFDAGSATAEHLRWEDSLERFGLSDDLAVEGPGLFVNAGGPEGDSRLYFFDGGSDSGRSLRWDDVASEFEFDDRVRVGEDLLIDGSNIRINADGPDGAQNIYFWDAGVAFAQSFGWSDVNHEFFASDDLSVGGILHVDGAQLYVNADGPEGDSTIGFYESGSRFNEYLRWDDSLDEFYLSDQLTVNDEIHTYANQIVLNDNGPNTDQDIEFFNGTSQFERFQWDTSADRFEVSDDFHAFGDLSTSGAKPFVQNHPYRDDLEIVYTAIEGNEVTTFTRGSARLEGGEVRIELEESFRHVTNPDLGLTAHLTPRGEWTDLFVDSITTSELVVRSVTGADAAFDFTVYGLRVGYEDYPVYRPKRAESFAPMPGQFEEDFSAEPTLANHTALARYRAMAGEVFGRTEIEMSGAWALREAIGMREPDRDYPRGSELSVGEMNRLALEKEGAGSSEPGDVGLADGMSRDAESGTGTSESGASSLTTTGLQRDADGNVYARSFRPAAGDIASLVEVAEPVEAGDVLVIDPLAPGRMSLGREAGDAAVFGIVAAEPGVMLGASDPAASDAAEVAEVPVAVSGIVSCKVDAGWGAIRAGDLLQTSPTPGHAMRAEDPRVGTVLGKALEPLDVGTGVIRVLVTLR